MTATADVADSLPLRVGESLPLPVQQVVEALLQLPPPLGIQVAGGRDVADECGGPGHPALVVAGRRGGAP